MSWVWRIRHFSPTGVVIKDMTQDTTPTVASIEWMSVRGNGDCVEAIFNAVPADVNIGLRDLIQVFIEDTLGGGNEIPIFYGVVTKVGSNRSLEIQEFRVAGFAKRVREISPTDVLWPNPFPVLTEDVAVAAERAAQYLPGAVVTDHDIPELGFHVGPMILNRAPAGLILDDLVRRVPGFTVPSGDSYVYDGVTFNPGDFVPFTEWGVNADRELFFRRPLTTMVLTEGEEVSNVIYHERSSEEFYTVAAAIMKAGEGETPAFREYQDDALVAQYGKSIKRFSVDSLFMPQNGSAIIVDPSGLTGTFYEKSEDNGQNWSNATTVQGNTLLQDRYGHTMVRFRKTQQTHTGDVLRAIGVGYSWTDPQFVMEVVAYPKYTYRAPGIQVPGADYEQRVVQVMIRIDIGGNWVWEPIADIPTNEESTIYVNAMARGVMIGYKDFMSNQSNHEYRLAELQVKTLDLDLVERIARSYFKRMPEDKIELVCYDEYVPPAATCVFEPFNGDPIEMPVAEIRYSITANGGIVSTVTLGQAYDADMVAEAEIMKQNMDLMATEVIDWTNNNL